MESHALLDIVGFPVKPVIFTKFLASFRCQSRDTLGFPTRPFQMQWPSQPRPWSGQETLQSCFLCRALWTRMTVHVSQDYRNKTTVTCPCHLHPASLRTSPLIQHFNNIERGIFQLHILLPLLSEAVVAEEASTVGHTGSTQVAQVLRTGLSRDWGEDKPFHWFRHPPTPLLLTAFDWGNLSSTPDVWG